MSGGAFDDLTDPAEDVHTLEGGKPFVMDVRQASTTHT